MTPTVGQLAFVDYGTCVATYRVSFMVTRGQDAGRVLQMHSTEDRAPVNYWPKEARCHANGQWTTDGMPVRFQDTTAA